MRISGLKPDKSVVVTEVAAPPGFIKDTQAQTIQIKAGKTVTLTFKNQPIPDLTACLRSLSGTATLGIAQAGMLDLSTEHAYYMQTAMREPAATPAPVQEAPKAAPKKAAKKKAAKPKTAKKAA